MSNYEALTIVINVAATVSTFVISIITLTIAIVLLKKDK